MIIINEIKRYLSSPEQFSCLLEKLARKKFVRKARKNHNKIHQRICSLDYSDVSYAYFYQGKDISANSEVLAQANKYLDGKYDLLGSGELVIDRVDWHKDYVSGYRWAPGTFYLDYTQESIQSNSDVKWPRELSRCHQLLQVAVAYDMTKDSRYAEYVLKNIENWIDNNPLMYSINWGCTMDVAIRAVNWIWSLSILSSYNDINQEQRHKVLSSLFEHGWFIYHNPEKTGRYNHNHYLADLSGQIQLGLLFNYTEEGQEWLTEGINSLFEEIRQQILPSGMSYERSMHYDRLVLELVLVPVLLLKYNGYEVPQDIWYRMESMFDFMMYMIKPDGEAPIVGDQDNGRLLPFSNGELTDFRYLMSLGALLFNRDDMKAFGNGYNLYCHYLCQDKSKEDFEKLRETTAILRSRAFSDAGFYIMRHDKDYLLFNASGKGLYPELCNTTHTHSDLLSVELASDGETFLCDSGSFCYTADAEQRKLFRSTCMHNTVTVDGESQNVIFKENLWDFERNAIPSVNEWSSNMESDLVLGSHTGYLRLQDPVTHERSVIYNKIKRSWYISDVFTAKGKHEYKAYYHFASSIQVEVENNTLIAKGNNGALRFVFKCSHEYSIEVIPSFISRSYGTKQESKAVVVTMNGKGLANIQTLISKI